MARCGWMNRLSSSIAASRITSPIKPMNSASIAVDSPVSPIGTESYWLITEDHGSIGHAIDVYMGGVLIHTVKSGDDQLLMDVGEYLTTGRNVINFTAKPGAEFSGGALHVYLGKGSNVEGTIELLGDPIEFIRRSSDDPAGLTSQHTLDIP